MKNKEQPLSEKQIQNLENVGVISMFLAVKFAKDLQLHYGHVFTNQLKEVVYSDMTKETHSLKEISQSKKKLKSITKDFSSLLKYEAEVLKIATLNTAFNKIFEGNGMKVYNDLEKKFKRSILMIVEQLGEETYKSQQQDETK